MRTTRRREPDIPPDPFNERGAVLIRSRMRLLGGDFVFDCGSSELGRLVDHAYDALPRHSLGQVVPRLRVALMPAPRDRPRRRGEPPRIEMLSGAGLLCGTSSRSDFAVMSADYRSALVVLSRDMLRSSYHARYELLEFAVFTLASRAQRLTPLHGACVGANGRGLLLLGGSGAGKSTASLHCLLRGLDFVSEDSVFVEPQSLRVTGVANFLHIRHDSLRFLGKSDAAAIAKSAVIRRRSGVEKLEIDLRQRQYPLAAKPPKLAALVFISPERARDGRLLRPIPRRDLLMRVAQSQPFAAQQPGWDTFKRQLAATGAFELRRGRHPGECVDALQGLLTG